MSDEVKNIGYSTGIAFRRINGKVVEQVEVNMSAERLFFPPDHAREFAIDILMQADRVEKHQTWEALNNSNSENIA